MIHLELGPSTIVGVGLSVVGLLLYYLKINRPDVSRDYDLLFSSIGLLCGGILIFQGWRLDPILLLCQILSCGTAIFFIGESVWLRKTIQIYSKPNIYDLTIQKSNIVFDYEKQIIQYLYDRKLSLYNITIPHWEQIDYTAPIEYYEVDSGFLNSNINIYFID
uniref:Hypothetical chloroplast RF66 n=1 Tax=Netrium digitus TaxID=43946 RepID=A0A191T588_9VIRI|nr:hypothetical chloroplast RF66 [Netrium digitus]ANI25547.1 hypothetical chloroplast RF66 [Netrium digitus]